MKLIEFDECTVFNFENFCTFNQSKIFHDIISIILTTTELEKQFSAIWPIIFMKYVFLGENFNKTFGVVNAFYLDYCRIKVILIPICLPKKLLVSILNHF